MYIEETGDGDGDIKVTVDGEEYTAEANYDLNGDGVDDTVAVMTNDGFIAYIDANHDGQADLMQTINSHGEVTKQARFHPDTGQWTGEQPDPHPVPDPHQPDHHDQQMVIETPQGDRQVGLPTEDTNSDGKPDTAVVNGHDGATMLVTDVDGDGSADQVVEISTTGDVTIAHHTGHGQWTVTEHGRINDDGKYAPSPHNAATDDATWTFDEPAPSAPTAPPAPTPAPNAAMCSGEPAAPTSDAVWE